MKSIEHRACGHNKHGVGGECDYAKGKRNTAKKCFYQK